MNEFCLCIEFGQCVFHAADLVGSQNTARQNSVAVSVDGQRHGLGRRLVDRDVVDAADLFDRSTGELRRDILTGFSVAAGGDKELCVLQCD